MAVGVALFLAALGLAAGVVFGVPAIRRALLSRRIMAVLSKALPRVDDAERTALNVGTLGWVGELFSGSPNWKNLLAARPHPLSQEEQAFLDGPVEELCAKLDERKLAQDEDLSQELWRFMKDKGF